MAGAVPLSRSTGADAQPGIGGVFVHVTRRRSTRRWTRLLLMLGAVSACRGPAPDGTELDEVVPDPAAPVTQPAPGFHPIVDAVDGQLFGAAADGRWLDATSAAPRVREGTTYRLYALTRRIDEGEGSQPLPPAETCTNPRVQVGEPLPDERDLIAVAGPWDALPRPVSVQSPDQTVYHDLVVDWLREHGIAEPLATIDQLLRVDLDGDGADEVLIAANLLRGVGTSALPGDYSVVLLRRLIGNSLRTIALAEEYYPDGCFADCAPAEHRVAGILDLNGDGVMEVVLAWRDYEGRGKTVHQVDGIDIEEVLSWLCAP